MIIKPYDHVQVATELARRVHAKQTDKVGQPYFDHVERVALAASAVTPHRSTSVIEGTDTLTTHFLHETDDSRLAATVGYLHDTVEDTWVTLAMIEFIFGTEVEEAVDAVTRREGERYPELIERAKQHPIARLVKIADLRDNWARLGTIEDGVTRARLAVKYARALRSFGVDVDSL